MCRLWQKIASDDDVLKETSSRRDNQGDSHRNRGGANYGHSSNHHHPGPTHDYPPKHPHMPYPPHPMYNPYGYPVHPAGHHMFRPMPGDARNQIGHPMMHQPRLGLHHGGPYRPSRPWWNVSPLPPPHLTQSHYPPPNSHKHFGSEASTPQPSTSTSSSTVGAVSNSPVSVSRSRNSYSQQRARKQQQLKQKKLEQVNSIEASCSKTSTGSAYKDNQKLAIESNKAGGSITDSGRVLDEKDPLSADASADSA